MKLDGVSLKDDRRVEIMATALPLYKGMPLICDASLVSPVKANSIAQPRAAHKPGVAIAHIEEKKATTYPELVSSSRCKFLVLAGEVGGRWSDATCRLIRDLATAKSPEAAPGLRKSAAFAWENRWWSMISVATQNALAATLVDDAPHMLHPWEGLRRLSGSFCMERRQLRVASPSADRECVGRVRWRPSVDDVV